MRIRVGLELAGIGLNLGKQKQQKDHDTFSHGHPQYCWEFLDQLREALSTSEERGAPSRTEGERIVEMLWRLQMP